MSTKDFDKFVQAGIDEGLAHGFAVACGSVKGIAFSRGYGLADPVAGTPMTPSVMIDIASVTKVLATAPAVLLCSERGLLDLDAPFSDYLPDYTGGAKGRVSVRDLALHTSGYETATDSNGYYSAITGADAVRLMLACSPSHDPGTFYSYACWNYNILALMVSQLVPEGFKPFVERGVFGRLGLSSTSLGVPKPGAHARTQGTAAAGSISDPTAFIMYRDGMAAGNAGAFSTVEDLSAYCIRLLAGGAGFLSPESLMEMRRNYVPAPLGVKRSVGWVMDDGFVPEGFSADTVYHTGWSGQSVYIDFGRDFFAVVLSVRCGEHEAAKRHRMNIAAAMAKMF
ncbi:MAG: serine hydrolase domain-containing protein [Kiritimatiellia bacterium]|jgi:CubicO group peptidase (beta-lactamase class C family)